MQRLLGNAGRTTVDRARGIGPRAVTPRRLPASVGVRHRSPRTSLTVPPRVRSSSAWSCSSVPCCSAAGRPHALTLTFADGPAWEKTRRLPEPSWHEDDLRRLTYQLMDAAGLQRGRLTALALRAKGVADADQVAGQLSLDTARQTRLTVERACDRIREKFGPGGIGPAATYRPAC
ncbi:hypothetical protein ACWDFR_22150 [Streptomyces sp. 900105755]